MNALRRNDMLADAFLANHRLWQELVATTFWMQQPRGAFP